MQISSDLCNPSALSSCVRRPMKGVRKGFVFYFYFFPIILWDGINK